MRRIRQVNGGGAGVGMSMLDRIFEEVKVMDLKDRKEIGDELQKSVKIYNYVPKPVEEQFRTNLVEESGNYQEQGR